MKTTLKVLFLSTALGALAFPALAEDLVVGLATAQTGGLAPYDQPSLKGLQMAVDEINAAGGIAGKFPIKLVAKDTRSDAAQTALVAQQMAAQNQLQQMRRSLPPGHPAAEAADGDSPAPGMPNLNLPPSVTGGTGQYL